MALDRRARIVGITALVELGTGIALLVDPAPVVTLLLKMPSDATAQVLGRGFGVTLLALAAALRPERRSAAVPVPAFQAALIYNALIPLFLACVSVVKHVGGWALWGAVALHAVLAVLLLTTWQGQHRQKPSGM